MNFLVRYFRINKFYLFLAMILANILIMWLSEATLINDVVFYNTFSEQLSYDRSMAIFDGFRKYSWIGYTFMPIVFIIKFSIISVLIYSGIFLYDLHEKISFKIVFGVVVASESVFLLANLIKFLWFLLFAGNYDLNDMKFFYPLSLCNLFSQSEVDKIWISLLQSLNIFQILYVLLLSYGLYAQTGVQQNKTEKAVLASYIPGLVIWIALIMFLTIDSSL